MKYIENIEANRETSKHNGSETKHKVEGTSDKIRKYDEEGEQGRSPESKWNLRYKE